MKGRLNLELCGEEMDSGGCAGGGLRLGYQHPVQQPALCSGSPGFSQVLCFSQRPHRILVGHLAPAKVSDTNTPAPAWSCGLEGAPTLQDALQACTLVLGQERAAPFQVPGLTSHPCHAKHAASLLPHTLGPLCFESKLPHFPPEITQYGYNSSFKP